MHHPLDNFIFKVANAERASSARSTYHLYLHMLKINSTSVKKWENVFLGAKMTNVLNYVEHRFPKISLTTHSYEYYFLEYIEIITPERPDHQIIFLDALFNGAYIFIPDGGLTYQTLSSYAPTQLINRNSSSSHFSLETQYEITGDVIKHCLFGTNVVDEKIGTWIQLEAYGTDLLHAPAHLYTYAKYLFTGYNQGPHGISGNTEDNPIFINFEETPPPAVISQNLSDSSSIMEPTINSIDSKKNMTSREMQMDLKTTQQTLSTEDILTFVSLTEIPNETPRLPADFFVERSGENISPVLEIIKPAEIIMPIEIII